jgi:hypothetical protein
MSWLERMAAKVVRSLMRSAKALVQLRDSIKVNAIQGADHLCESFVMA